MYARINHTPPSSPVHALMRTQLMAHIVRGRCGVGGLLTKTLDSIFLAFHSGVATNLY